MVIVLAAAVSLTLAGLLSRLCLAGLLWALVATNRRQSRPAWHEGVMSSAPPINIAERAEKALSYRHPLPDTLAYAWAFEKDRGDEDM
jgi:hypothetical protein